FTSCYTFAPFQSEIIESKGYSATSYRICTPDDYVLTVHRISPKRPRLKSNRNVVLLQHGLLDSSHTWINNLVNQSLGFILSDMGYDVWLGNSRGSTYSQYHKTLDASSEEFWQFSWDDMAQKDLPATVDFVLSQTGKKKLFYIGHSQGTEIAFAKLNSDPVFRSKVAAMVALAPVVYLANVKSPLRLMSAVCKKMKFVNTLFGILPGGLLSLFPIVRFFSLLLCHERSFPFLCSWILSVFVGFDPDNTNMVSWISLLLYLMLKMVCLKCLSFDFGKEGNMFHYYQPVPPVYGLGNIDIPLKLYWGGDDTLSTPSDVRSLIDELPRRSYIRNMYLPYYNHLEFVWGLDAAELIYPDILDFLREFQ
ncbi:unnamed protein product, partial [Schistocephalus solidus]|uniref:AB hydrolase-1 domain-containing protein n=1 Tax=Schistocephalus solidus TaxID=70667 RepID=A0A183TAW6_SCHSO